MEEERKEQESEEKMEDLDLGEEEAEEVKGGQQGVTLSDTI